VTFVVITVLSDTHIPRVQNSLPGEVVHAIEEADAIIGLGDFIDEETLFYLNSFGKPVYAVLGNMDRYELRSRLPLRKTLELNGFRIFMTHGWGAPNGIEKRIFNTLDKPLPDLCLYGHSHVASDSTLGSIRFINPGTCRRGGGYAVLKLEKEIVCDFFKLD